MRSTDLPSCPIPHLRVIELTADHGPDLQRFFEANPAYFQAITGAPAGPDEAHAEMHDELPPGWSFTKKWLLGYQDAQGRLVAMANVVSDLLAPRVWHIGLFMVAESLHGTGAAQALYHGLETWAVSNGACWLRLGVAQGNLRAESFWERLGYIQTRTRVGVEMGSRTNTIRVLAKPVAGGSLAQYLALVERDRPEPDHAP